LMELSHLGRRLIPLVVEVVSTNWSVDYALKFDEYSDVGIPEYWMVDSFLYKGSFFRLVSSSTNTSGR
ncbi:MAG: Uma2 family endonuclease, partial [Cyanobacteria bacterium J06635_10]